MCNAEAPSVEEVATAWAGKVDIVGVAWQGSESAMQAFIDKHALTFPQINDDPAVVFERFQIPGQPAWVFIDRNGEVTVHLGTASDDLLNRTLTDLSA